MSRGGKSRIKRETLSPLKFLRAYRADSGLFVTDPFRSLTDNFENYLILMLFHHESHFYFICISCFVVLTRLLLVQQQTPKKSHI